MQTRRWTCVSILIASFAGGGCGLPDLPPPLPSSSSDASVDSSDTSPQRDAESDAGVDSAADAAPDTATHPPFPNVTNVQGGAMTGAVKLITIVASNDTEQASLLSFGNAVAQSSWWSTVSAQYGLTTLSHRQLVGSALSAGALTTHEIQQYIASVLGQHAIVPDARTINLLFLPDGVFATDDNGQSSNANCSQYVGYHYFDVYTPNRSFIWAVTQRCAPFPTIRGLATVLDTVTWNATHEIIETATDPHGDDGYSINAGVVSPPNSSPFAIVPALPGEVGDLCAWTVHRDSGWAYTRVWSNAAANVGGDPCVPRGTEPYACASTAAGWYSVQPGGTVDIQVTGWTPAPTTSWTAWADLDAVDANNTAFTILPTTAFTLNAGVTKTLHVTAPSGAASGSYAVFLVSSETATEIHPWAVGVYVP